MNILAIYKYFSLCLSFNCFTFETSYPLCGLETPNKLSPISCNIYFFIRGNVAFRHIALFVEVIFRELFFHAS